MMKESGLIVCLVEREVFICYLVEGEFFLIIIVIIMMKESELIVCPVEGEVFISYLVEGELFLYRLS